MNVSLFHAFRQRATIATLARVVSSSVGQKIYANKSNRIEIPGTIFSDTIPPRSQRLINDYIYHVGGDPLSYKGILPPHFFPQWGFPLLAQTIASLPYDPIRILNGGVLYEVRKPLPSTEPLRLTAQLMNVDDNGRRIVFHQKLVTGTESAPEALIAEISAILPLKETKKSPILKKEKPKIHDNAQEIGRIHLNANAGLEFALLTGDFNPVHWIGVYARLSGFSNTILHGFSTMARAAEILVKNRLSGRANLLERFEAKFVKPLVLPNKVSIFIQENQIWVGHVQGGEPYLTGQFTIKEKNI